jgi:phage-related protein (TIGR01555 family)
MTYREDGALLDAYAGMYNLSTGTGTRRDKSLNFEINVQATTITREECEVLFKTSGLVQKIVALLPEDSPVEWYSLNLGKDNIAPQDIVNYMEDKLNLHEKLVEASVLARLHHNAYIVIFANDGRTPDQAIDEENLQEITELKVLSSYELRPSVWGTEIGGHSLIEPEYYDLIGLWELNRRLPDGQKVPLNQTRIHKSRVLRFSGRKLYGWMLNSNQGNDLSILQSIVIAFSSYMQSIMASSGMIQDYSVFTYKLKGLSDLILQGQSDAIIRRFLAIQLGMSYNKGLAMDAETEEAEFVHRNYGGVGDIVDRLKHLLTAESGIPHTKLWGEGSQGNTSGQSEKYDYADAQESFQRHNWLKPTRTIARLCLISKLGVTKGKEPKGWKISTKSSMRLDMEAEAKLRQTQARTDQIYRMLGSLHPLEIRKNRYGSPEWTMETTLDPEIDKLLWEHKDDPEFMLPVLGGKPTGMAAGGTAHSGVDEGTKIGQKAIAASGGDGGTNAQMQAEESDRERMADKRRTDAAVKRFKWGDRTLAVEYLPGDLRHSRTMEGIYGYIQKHTGHDNQPLDFYATKEFYQALSDGEQPTGKIFEVYQLKANADDWLERKTLDETKIILGCNTVREAMDLYLAHMPEEFLGLINDLTPEELRHYRYRRDEQNEKL